MKLDYFAGLFDGEGCRGDYSRGKVRGPIFTMEVKMTSERVIREIKETFGGSVCLKPAEAPGRKDQWRWRLRGRKAEELYDRIKPELRIK